MSKAFGFLDLPAEIKNKIYRLVLIRDSGPDVPSHQRLIRSLAPPALTLTNKQIFTEALPIYYAENLFYILLCGEKVHGSDRDTSHFNRFIGMMEYFGRRVTSSADQKPLQSIQNLIIQIHTIDHLAISALEHFPFLQPADYSSVLAVSGLSRITMAFKSGDRENKPFDCTRYRWTVKAATDPDEHVLSAVAMLVEATIGADHAPEDCYQKPIMQAIRSMYDDGRDTL